MDNVVLIAHIQTFGHGQHLFAVAEIIIPVCDPHVPTFHVTVAGFVEVTVGLPHIKLQHQFGGVWCDMACVQDEVVEVHRNIVGDRVCRVVDAYIIIF